VSSSGELKRGVESLLSSWRETRRRLRAGAGRGEASPDSKPDMVGSWSVVCCRYMVFVVVDCAGARRAVGLMNVVGDGGVWCCNFWAGISRDRDTPLASRAVFSPIGPSDQAGRTIGAD
jgi:hypothetical protein